MHTFEFATYLKMHSINFQGLADTEEFVISKALFALSNLAELGLIQKQMLYEVVTEAIPLLIHPVSHIFSQFSLK